MIDISVNVEYDQSEVEGWAAEAVEEHIRSGGIECPADECNSRDFDVRLWSGHTGVEGRAICGECGSEIDIDVDLSEVEDAIDEIASTFENI